MIKERVKEMLELYEEKYSQALYFRSEVELDIQKNGADIDNLILQAEEELALQIYGNVINRLEKILEETA